jgi:hemoglobin
MTTDTTSSEEKRELLLDRLGGEDALTAAVSEFYGRIMADDVLAPFFDGIVMEVMKVHQFRFMKIAFTGIPENYDVAAMIAQKHQRLFGLGLNETHFDLVAGHLVASLEKLGVAQSEIEEVVAVVGPLRVVFEEGAKRVAKGKEQLLDRLGGPAALKEAVHEFYGRILFDEELAPFFEHTDMDKLRAHQYKFMEIAFTEIPEGLDVVKYLSDTHARLFEKGLNATHFDLVAGHLVGALKNLKVEEEVINEVVARVGPLRAVFDKEPLMDDSKIIEQVEASQVSA